MNWLKKVLEYWHEEVIKCDAQITKEQFEGGKEKIKAIKENVLDMFKAVKAYFDANPKAYTTK